MADTDVITWFERTLEASEFLDLSDALSTLVNVSTEFLGDIKEGSPADGMKFQWPYDALNSQQVTLNGTINNSTTSMNVATGHGVRLRVGSILQSTENIAADAALDSQADRLIVTAISTDAITLNTRGSIGTAKAHTDATVFKILNHTMSDVGTLPSDNSTDRDVLYNFCEFFADVTNTPWTRKFSKSSIVPDEESYQLAQRMIEMRERINRVALNGIKGYTTITSRYYHTDGMLAATSSGIRTTTAANISASLINDLNAAIRAAARGHDLPTRLIAKDNIIRAISAFGSDKIFIDPHDRVRGQWVTRFRTDLGNMLDLISDDNMPPGHLTLYNPENVAIRTLIPFGAFRMPQATTADLVLLLTVLGFEFRNPNQLFATHTAVDVP